MMTDTDGTMDLKGKVAIVTGGNSGIGLAIVVGLAEAGANVVIDYVVRPEATAELEKRVLALGSRAIGVDADVSTIADLQTLVDKAVSTFGRLDIMVNNAGVETRTSILDTDEATCREADDRPRRRRPHHQSQFDSRGLADAGQHRLLPLQRWNAHAHAHRRC